MGYEWQHETYDLWKGVGFRGILQGITGVGKTIAGCKTLQSYIADHPGARILILTPRQEIKKQWVKTLEDFGIEGSVLGYQMAISKYAQGKMPEFDVVVADECHNLLTEVQGRLIRENHLPYRILGMSATPESSDEIIGPVFQNIGYDKATLAPFTVHYITFTPSPGSRAKYDWMTNKMKEYCLNKYGRASVNPGRDSQYMRMTLTRRSFSYLLKERVPIAMTMIKDNFFLGRRIMVFSERVKQVEELSKRLTEEGIPHAVQTGGRNGVQRFLDKEVDIVLSVKQLEEGFNDPSADVAIIMSSATTTRSHIQTIGRVIRPAEGKRADIFVLLAKDTSDSQLRTAVPWPKNIPVKDVGWWG